MQPGVIGPHAFAVTDEFGQNGTRFARAHKEIASTVRRVSTWL